VSAAGGARLSATGRLVLLAMAGGATLKMHRTLDGEKRCLLHPLDGAPVEIERTTVERLKRRGLILANMKFPAATYLLTESGVAALGSGREAPGTEDRTSEDNAEVVASAG
jgi:hypothetical protein